MALWLLFMPRNPVTGGEESRVVLLVILFVVSLPYWALAFGLLRRRVPKGFDAFNQDL